MRLIALERGSYIPARVVSPAPGHSIISSIGMAFPPAPIRCRKQEKPRPAAATRSWGGTSGDGLGEYRVENRGCLSVMRSIRTSVLACLLTAAPLALAIAQDQHDHDQQQQQEPSQQPQKPKGQQQQQHPQGQQLPQHREEHQPPQGQQQHPAQNAAPQTPQVQHPAQNAAPQQQAPQTQRPAQNAAPQPQVQQQRAPQQRNSPAAVQAAPQQQAPRANVQAPNRSAATRASPTAITAPHRHNSPAGVLRPRLCAFHGAGPRRMAPRRLAS